MKEEDLSKLKKTLYWCGGIIAVALTLELLFWSVATYRANKAINDLVGDMQRATETSRAGTQAFQQKRQLEQRNQQQIKLDQNTLCAMNTDTSKCACIHRQTGQKISMPQHECVSRASGRQ